MKTALITKDTLIGEIVKQHPETVETLVNSGMHCLGCPSAQGESLETACIVHGMDAEKVVEALNAKIVEKQQSKKGVFSFLKQLFK